MEFPDIHEQKKHLVEHFCCDVQRTAAEVRAVASPYRICPLGAHIDHQGGPVLGMTINAYTLMVYCAAEDGVMRLRSRNYPGEARFSIHENDKSTGSFWGVYPWAAVMALREQYEVKQGVVGLLDGMLPGCGLSSSASVLLAYLFALADVNGLELDPWDYVTLTRRAEREFIGLNNGILDQTSIVFGRKGMLLHIDTVREEVHYLEDRLGEGAYRLLVAYSGHSRELTTSGYNSRVDECREAARELSNLAGHGGAKILSEIPPAHFGQFGDRLRPELFKRSSHFFSESKRVQDGIAAWEKPSIAEFGRLMNASCSSSMDNYECGMQALHDLQQIVSSTEGVFGSRFMGGGFGGCVVGLVKPESAATAIETIDRAYKQLHPEVADRAAVYLARSDDGVRYL